MSLHAFTLADDSPAPRRLVSLTPMIDVVFLLLVFFMLVSRFETESHLALASGGAGAGAPTDGPPRLISVDKDSVALNGEPVALDALGAALRALAVEPDALIIVKTRDGANVQRLLDVIDTVNAANFSNIVLLE